MDPVLTDTQNWSSRSHRELYDAVHHNNDPGQAGQIGSEWAQFGAELTESAELITQRVTSTESGWTGESADAARVAIKLLSEWVTETASTAVEVGNRVADQGQVMESARASMPEPVEFDYTQATQNMAGGGLAGLLASTAAVHAAQAASRAAHEQAVTVMTAMETNSRTIDTSTPVFTAPFNPVTGKEEEPPKVALMRTTGMATLAGAASAPSVGEAASQPTAMSAPTGASAPMPAAAAPAMAAPDGFAAGSPGAGYVAPERVDTTSVAAAAPTAVPAYQPPTYTGGNVPQPSTGMSGQFVPGVIGGTGTSGTRESGGSSTPSGPGGRGAGPGAAGTGTFGPGAAGAGTGRTGVGGPGVGGPGASRPGTSGTGPRIGAGTFGPGGAGPGPGASGLGSGGSGAGGSGASGLGAGGAGGSGAGGSGGSGAGGAGARGGFVPGSGGGAFAAGANAAAPLQPGGATGALQPGRGPVPGAGFAPGVPGAAGAAGAMGGAPMAGAAKSDEDKERRSAYPIIEGDLFEVPGAELPPAVIGGAKPKKKDQS